MLYSTLLGCIEYVTLVQNLAPQAEYCFKKKGDSHSKFNALQRYQEDQNCTIWFLKVISDLTLLFQNLVNNDDNTDSTKKPIIS